MNDARNDSYDEDFSGELLTIKGSNHSYDYDSLEKTIRPMKKTDPSGSHVRTNSSISKLPANNENGQPLVRSPPKSHQGNKFELPSRPDLVFREQSIEDYSDLFLESDQVFDHGVAQALQTVCSMAIWKFAKLLLNYHRVCGRVMRPDYFIPLISRVYPGPYRLSTEEVYARRRLLDHPCYLIALCGERAHPSRYSNLLKRMMRTFLTYLARTAPLSRRKKAKEVPRMGG